MSNFVACQFGFQMTFDNGYTASVQWKEYNYCTGKGEDESPDAEIAAFHQETGDWITREWHPGIGDDVAGRVSPDTVADFIYWVKNYKG